MAKSRNEQQPTTTTTTATSLQVIEQQPSEISTIPEGAQVFLKAVEGPRRSVQKLPIITIDHENVSFILPTGEVTAEVSGYPVYFFQTRSFYKAAPRPGEQGKPPDCWSPDLVNSSPQGLNRQQECCLECPKAAWGSAADGRGQACSTKTWLFLLNGKFGTPPIAALVLPPSSIKALLGTKFSGGYLSQAQARGGAYEIVWSHFRLKQQGDKVKYCTIEPHMGKVCDDNERILRIAHVRNDFIKIMEELRGATPDLAADVAE